MLDVNSSLLRFWEKEFKLVVSKKNAKGNRLFSVKEIEKLNQMVIEWASNEIITNIEQYLKFKETQNRDNMKNEYCIKNNYEEAKLLISELYEKGFAASDIIILLIKLYSVSSICFISLSISNILYI